MLLQKWPCIVQLFQINNYKLRMRVTFAKENYRDANTHEVCNIKFVVLMVYSGEGETSSTTGR